MVHEIRQWVGKYIMEQRDDLFYTETQFIV